MYPGGSYDSKPLVGYHWTPHYTCTLFHATALNGEPNPSRYFALPAMLFLSVSIAFVFNEVSAAAPTHSLRKMIQIGGIGSMVYGFLAPATPIHDLLVAIALINYFVAAVALLIALKSGRRFALLAFGSVALAILIYSAVLYYGSGLSPALAIAQKVSLILSASWVLACHWRMRGAAREVREYSSVAR